MEELEIVIDPNVEKVFDDYPDFVREKMINLRNLVIDTARETAEIKELEVTLKWGEPSFITKEGSTLRMDWKAKTPNQYAMYFQCTSKLVETFRLVYDQELFFEGKRAIVFPLDRELPERQVKACIKVCLTYHKVKHLMNLGL